MRSFASPLGRQRRNAQSFSVSASVMSGRSRGPSHHLRRLDVKAPFSVPRSMSPGAPGRTVNCSLPGAIRWLTRPMLACSYSTPPNIPTLPSTPSSGPSGGSVVFAFSGCALLASKKGRQCAHATIHATRKVEVSVTHAPCRVVPRKTSLLLRLSVASTRATALVGFLVFGASSMRRKVDLTRSLYESLLSSSLGLPYSGRRKHPVLTGLATSAKVMMVRPGSLPPLSIRSITHRKSSTPGPQSVSAYRILAIGRVILRMIHIRTLATQMVLPRHSAPRVM